MAEAMSDSDSDEDIVSSHTIPPPKRRRIIDPSAITAVPVYTNKVNSSLQLKPVAFKQIDCTEGSKEEEARLWSPSRPKNKPISITLSDSEEEQDQIKPLEVCRSPSPPMTPSTLSVRKTRRANKKIREINKTLDGIGLLVSQLPERPEEIPNTSSSFPINDYYDDDIIIVATDKKRKKHTSEPKPQEQAREISLKFRWRTDIHKITVLSTDPLRIAVDKLAVKLKVSPSKILLLRKDTELPLTSTTTELGLGIADIIDCVVMTEDKDDVITVRLQGKKKSSTQEYSVHKDAPLGSVLSQYMSGLSAVAKGKIKFLFDGSKVTPNQTPSQLDMEDGDVIEVWA
ncbi:NFATC2-interacting protein [Trichomycterus rosablanca]|uniref:NFATC2-interacting protein n=1 Tax=Trichomycterus rosablanca TaxID=2290929 RepID=UPI002F359C6A